VWWGGGGGGGGLGEAPWLDPHYCRALKDEQIRTQCIRLVWNEGKEKKETKG